MPRLTRKGTAYTKASHQTFKKLLRHHSEMICLAINNPTHPCTIETPEGVLRLEYTDDQFLLISTSGAIEEDLNVYMDLNDDPGQ